MNSQTAIITDTLLDSLFEQFIREISGSYRRILFITPDSTRTCPLNRIVPVLQKYVRQYSVHADYLVALGTHKYMEEESIRSLYGIDSSNEGDFEGSALSNHAWKDPQTFETFGSVELVPGDSTSTVDIQLNRRILEYDILIPVSPVFPHEIVGFSGGPKYFFPGISGGEFLQKMHWQAVCIGRVNLMGIKDTPTRRMINRAAGCIPRPVRYITLAVDRQEQIRQISCGEYPETWEKSVEVSRKIHIQKTGRQYRKVVAITPVMYQDLWTAGKAMYKLDQIVEPGGDLILYAPHITEFSIMWKEHIEQIGFHTIEYLLAHTEKHAHIPEGVLAFSTNVRGRRDPDREDIDAPLVNLVLATGISQKRCVDVNLGFLDHHDIPWEMYRNDPDILIVDHAGEILHLV